MNINEINNLANKLSLLRILITPLVILLLYFPGTFTCILAVVLFIFASITDWLDGFIARRSQTITSIGKFLDPLADKLLICSILIMFVALSWAPAWVVIIIVCRELLVTGLRAIAVDEGIILAADKFGKAKTVLQILAIVPILLHFPIAGMKLWILGEFALYVSMLLAIFSGYNYCVYFYRHTSQRKVGDKADA